MAKPVPMRYSGMNFKFQLQEKACAKNQQQHGRAPHEAVNLGHDLGECFHFCSYRCFCVRTGWRFQVGAFFGLARGYYGVIGRNRHCLSVCMA